MELLRPEWPAPANVRALSTTRTGGVSTAPFDSLNLGPHSGDLPQALAENEQRLLAAAGLPARPRWLQQVHGARVVDLDAGSAQGAQQDGADAAITRRTGVVCAIQSADCLPVLFAARDGSCVGAAHAGWRGLAAGVLENTVAALPAAPRQLLAWLGPAIGPSSFEVGAEVRDLFVGTDPGAAPGFVPSPRGRWLCDLFFLARRRLAAAGLTHTCGGGLCTFDDPRRFYSFRRDGRTGRMATLIWLAPPA